ncbi:LOW QUALITY PROTEIN: sodium transporter HKT1-like [Primulina tabacum]|uniref:LOW QUALITY PROTEIN: sodium transporter HKT1-like n=1 Tax=Primulina tabacum TaxID=48773 RepID=UPI003F598E14
MKNFGDCRKEIEGYIKKCLWGNLVWLYNSVLDLILYLIHILMFKINPFWIELFYFLSSSSLGFLVLKVSKPKSITTFRPQNLDLFFTDVSAVTVSSISTLEMEVFSNAQLIVLTILMFTGGEVFVSYLELQMKKAKISQKGIFRHYRQYRILSSSSNPNIDQSISDQIELGLPTCTDQFDQETSCTCKYKPEYFQAESTEENQVWKRKSIKVLSYVVSSYLIVIHAVGITSIAVYLSLTPSAKQVLNQKGLNISTFSFFTIVSTFSNCGLRFLPDNENMIIFKKNSGLSLLLIPFMLLGNTLYAACLRFLVFLLQKATRKEEFKFMLKNYRELGYEHLMSGVDSVYLAISLLGFLVMQMIVFCCLQWNSEVVGGLSFYEKIVGSFFQVVNSRHTGLSVFDLSAVSPGMLRCCFLFNRKYLPPYARFVPVEEAPKNGGGNPRRKRFDGFWERIMLSPLIYLAIFVFSICVTEREKIKRDPLNFNVFNIVFEVTSAYGNVGFSTGYSCEKQINPDRSCKNATYGFVGRWSDGGKLILIVVMFYGRLKKLNKKGGRGWKFS